MVIIVTGITVLSTTSYVLEEYGSSIRHLRYINYSRLLVEMNRKIIDKPLITPGQCSLYDHHILGDHYLCVGTTDPILQRITTNRYFYTERPESFKTN